LSNEIFQGEMQVNINPISMLPLQGPADPATLSSDPARLAKEFDAMVLRLLVGDLGKSLGGGSGGESELLGGVLGGPAPPPAGPALRAGRGRAPPGRSTTHN